MPKPLSILDLVSKYLSESYDDLVNNKGNAAQPLEEAASTVHVGPLRQLLDSLATVVMDYYEGSKYLDADVERVNVWFNSAFGGECIVGEPNKDAIAACILKVRDGIKERYAEDGYCIYEKDADPGAIEACKAANKAFGKIKDWGGVNRIAYAFGDTVVVSAWRGEVAGISVSVGKSIDRAVIHVYGDVSGGLRNTAEVIANAIGLNVDECKYDELETVEVGYLECPLNGAKPKEAAVVGAAAMHALLTEDWGELEEEGAKRLELERFSELASSG